MFRSARILIPVLGLIPGFACSGVIDDEASLEIAEAEQAIQYHFLRPGMEVVLGSQSNHHLARSTASLHSPLGTCGMTFVSPRYAITAAHCVDNQMGHEARQYDTQGVTNNRVVAQSWVDTSYGWPNWQHPYGLTEGDGYYQFPEQCWVVRRCGLAPFDCPVGAGSDIALVHCPNRGDSNIYSEVWNESSTLSPPLGTEVEVWWFHEVLALSLGPGGSDFEHYGKYDWQTHLTENYHYTEEHQLFPIHAYAQSNLPYEITEHIAGSTQTRADFPACHGTSGSGVFAKSGGVGYLLGPVISAKDAETRLCPDMRDAAPRSWSTFTNVDITRRFAQLREVQADRQLPSILHAFSSTAELNDFDEVNVSSSPDWRITSGRLRQYNNTGVSFQLLGDPFDNFSAYVDIKGPDNDVAGLVFRYYDSNNYYVAEVSEQLNYLRLRRRFGGTDVVLAQVPWNGNHEATKRLSVVANHGYLGVALVDSTTGGPTLTLHTYDDALSTGRLGVFQSYNDDIQFDNLAVHRMRTEGGAIIPLVASGWSQWFDRDNASGTGDHEVRRLLNVSCQEPLAIQAETTSGVPVIDTRDVLTLSAQEGLVCRNADQDDESCQDYRVRFFCP